MRKFLVRIPDFIFKKKKVSDLGHAFNHFAQQELMKRSDVSALKLQDVLPNAELAVFTFRYF